MTTRTQISVCTGAARGLPRLSPWRSVQNVRSAEAKRQVRAGSPASTCVAIPPARATSSVTCRRSSRCTLLTALVVAREWERGTMEALLATPVGAIDRLVGKVVPYFLLGLASMTLCGDRGFEEDVPNWCKHRGALAESGRTSRRFRRIQS
jgi:hypothetical protein